MRALKDGLSGVLKRVAAGETIEVTDHGKPVARLVPADVPDHIRKLIEEGAITPAEKPFEPLPSPLDLPDLGISLSDVIIQEREEGY